VAGLYNARRPVRVKMPMHAAFRVVYWDEWTNNNE